MLSDQKGIIDDRYITRVSQPVTFLGGKIPSELTITPDMEENISTSNNCGRLTIGSDGGESAIQFNNLNIDKLAADRFDAVSVRALIEMTPESSSPGDCSVITEFYGNAQSRIGHAFNEKEGNEATVQFHLKNNNGSQEFSDRWETRYSFASGVPMMTHVLWDWIDGRVYHRMQDRLALILEDPHMTKTDIDPGPWNPRIVCDSLTDRHLEFYVYGFEFSLHTKLD